MAMVAEAPQCSLYAWVAMLKRQAMPLPQRRCEARWKCAYGQVSGAETQAGAYRRAQRARRLRQAGADPDLEGWSQRFFMREDEQKQKWKCPECHPCARAQLSSDPLRQVKHIQAPGNKWASLGSSMATRVGELFGEMIVLGNFEAAQVQDQRCCAACLGEVGSRSKPSAAQWSRSRQVARVGCARRAILGGRLRAYGYRR
jgi:hypothetical protein